MNFIKQLREKKGIPQTSVASATGVTPQAVSKWERGESDPQWDIAPKLARVLGCTIDDLYGQPLIAAQEETCVPDVPESKGN